MATPEELSRVHETLMIAQMQTLEAYGCPETEEFQKARQQLERDIAEFSNPKPADSKSTEEEDWERFLNAQRTFIRAQAASLRTCKIYGDA